MAITDATSYKGSEQNVNRALTMSDDRGTIRIALDLTPEQAEQVFELHKLGVYNLKKRGKQAAENPNYDDDSNFEYKDRNTWIRQLIREYYEEKTGKPFGDDPEVGPGKT